MKEFFRKLFAGTDEVSFSRISAAVVLVFGLSWATYIVIKKLIIPELSGIAALATSLYGSGKLGETIQKFANNSKPGIPNA